MLKSGSASKYLKENDWVEVRPGEWLPAGINLDSETLSLDGAIQLQLISEEEDDETMV